MEREQGFYWVDLGEPIGETIGYWLVESNQWLIDGGVFDESEAECISDRLVCHRKH